MSVLIEDMRSEDTEMRIKAMGKLRLVAAALGPERTRNELLEFLRGKSCYYDCELVSSRALFSIDYIIPV